MITFSTTGVQNYSVVALGEAFGTPLGVANTALTANLMFSAFGVLIGGFLATRRGGTNGSRPARSSASQSRRRIGFVDFGFALLIVMMSLNGFVNGLMQPSRDMIVRAVTPEGQFGKVFGFVTTGFNIGGIIAPLLFGYVMDAGTRAGCSSWWAGSPGGDPDHRSEFHATLLV